MTEKLFYRDSHLTEFTGRVISCTADSPDTGCYKVVLDRTAFFPEGGGQSADVGVLAGRKVKDVQEKNDIIYHLIDGMLEVGAEVKGCIDYKERFSKMQQHTGEHIVSGLIHQQFGYDNVGFHLGNDAVTMDFNGDISKEQLQEIECKANEAVVENLDVVVEYPSKEQLKDMEYRSKIEIEGQVRIVTIPGYDVCACCAPHVKKTGEIGIIKLTDVQVHRGGVRVTMVCGFRALAHYNQLADSVHAISVALSAKEELVAEAVGRLKEENGSLKSQLTNTTKELLAYKVENIEYNQERVFMFEEALEGGDIRELANLLLAKNTKLAAVFAGNDQEGYRYVIGSKTEDTRKYAKAVNDACNGRGGGKPEMVQGSVTGTKASIEEAMEAVE